MRVKETSEVLDGKSNAFISVTSYARSSVAYMTNTCYKLMRTHNQPHYTYLWTRKAERTMERGKCKHRRYKFWVQRNAQNPPHWDVLLREIRVQIKYRVLVVLSRLRVVVVVRAVVRRVPQMRQRKVTLPPALWFP
jgi:hypothetical protein